MSREEFEALNRNYGTDVAGEVTPHMATHPSSSTDGTTVLTANKQVFNSRPGGHCAACVAMLSKLDDIVRSLSVTVSALAKSAPLLRTLSEIKEICN